MDTRIPQVVSLVCEGGAVPIRCSDQAAGQPEKASPVPHREQNSTLGVMGSPLELISSVEERAGQRWRAL